MVNQNFKTPINYDQSGTKLHINYGIIANGQPII